MARWGKIGRKGNVIDRRGMGGGLAFAGGGGLVVLLLTLGLQFMGLNVSQSTVEDILSQVDNFQSSRVDQADQPAEFRGEDDYEVFASRVLGSADAVWEDVFAADGRQYSPPRLVLFRDATGSACGGALSQIGPHYCPADSTIYLDETFFDQLKSRFGADTGEVAQAYVIAHEVGHHVQRELGVLDSPTRSTREGSIATELQADCYAGIWAYSLAGDDIFQDGEIDQALSAAAAVGDDNIQRRTTGQVSPESWTHGSSEQRVAAFETGFSSGNPSQCVNLN